ncbi:hypothetical protein B0H19DRAFT_1068386 [Mycena capillaripes]|nr:hypothetical protein B0H19DRAFT_1068386 [Mycena capillaripes]
MQHTLLETRCLFGPSNRPDSTTNVRHRAVLRKALELFPQAELEEIFQPTTKLCVVMGSAYTSNQLGKIVTNHVQNNRLVSRETAVPDVAARAAIRRYRDAYDAHFMKTGNDYRVRNLQAKHILQAAEQARHDWVMPYLAARGRPGRPAWALQPLPGFDRVRTTPAPRAVIALPRRAQAPPPTPSNTSLEVAPAPSTPARVPAGSALRPIIILDDDIPRPLKRKHLGVVDISDDEEEVVHPARRRNSWVLST